MNMHPAAFRAVVLATILLYPLGTRSAWCADPSTNATLTKRYELGPVTNIVTGDIKAGIPSERNDGGTDGYHCWAEFYADGKWYPVDISEADKFSSLSMYYFGHHPANRFEFTRGRDLVFNPGPASGPINFFAYPVLESNGTLVKVETFFGFRRLTPGK